MENKQLLFSSGTYYDHAEFWKEKISGVGEAFRLQMFHRELAGDKEFARTAFHIPEEQGQMIRRYAGGRPLESFLLLLSGLYILFSKYQDAEEVIIETPLMTDTGSDRVWERQVPLVEKIDAGRSIRELIYQVNEDVVKCYKYQNYPLDLLDGGSPQDGSSLVNKGRLSNILLYQDGLHAGPAPEDLAAYDLVIRVSPDEAGGLLRIAITYNIHSCDEEFISRMQAHFNNVLLHFSNPDTVIGSIDILPEEERTLLMEGLNNTVTDFPLDKTVIDIFMQQAALTPDGIALYYEGKTMSYEELDSRSTLLARHIRDKFSLKTGDLAGVMLEKSGLSIVCLLAILKAGGVYVPIDPGFPADRVDFMLRDADVRLVMTDVAGISKLSDYAGHLFVPELEWPSSDEVGTAALALPGANDNAYLIYTSGSTGTPKGVLVGHSGLVNVALDHVRELAMNEKDRYLQFMSLSFDGSLLDIFTALLSGAALVMPSPEVLSDIGRFIDFIEKHSVTLFTITPSFLHALDKAAMPLVHTIISAGEAAKPDDAMFYAGFKNFYNGYGPSETTVNATLYKVRPGEHYLQVPVGRVRANKQIYILDSRLQPRPMGLIGEICIGGVGLAKGYLNDEALTNEKFRSAPWDGSRLYLSGDLGRMLPDGNIQFLGRKDHQLKINGYRIDTGEIENYLQKHEIVREARIVVRQGEGSPEKSLIAFFTRNDAATAALPGNVSVEHLLKEFLASFFPRYMTPAAIREVAAFPVTSNGKIDNQALLRSFEEEAAGAQEHRQPATVAEKLLVTFWTEIFGRPGIGTQSDFFILGGDSIKAIQTAAKMSAAGFKMDVKHIFENPVLSQLARAVTPLTHAVDQSPVTGPVPMLPIQQDLLSGKTPDPHHYNQSVMIFSAKGFDEQATAAVFRKLQEHHDALRMVVTYGENGPALFNNGLDHPLSLEVLDPDAAGDADSFIRQHADRIQQSMDLEKGPLMKLALFKSAKGDRLLIIIHHLVVDGVSWRILLEDIDTLYGQYDKGEALQLPLKTDSFQAWANKLHAFAASDVCKSELPYWQRVTDKNIPGLPLDFQGGSNLESDSIIEAFNLTSEQTDVLLTKAPSVLNASIHEVLLACTATAMRRCFGVKQVLVGMEGHGREQLFEDIVHARTVGWFTTAYPFLIETGEQVRPEKLVQSVKQQWESIPGKGIAYGLLKQSSRRPHIGFNYLGQFDTDIRNEHFRVLPDITGKERSSDQERICELDIRGLVAAGKLHLTITFNKTRLESRTILQLRDEITDSLQEVIRYCTETGNDRMDPGRFTYKDLTMEDIDSILS